MPDMLHKAVPAKAYVFTFGSVSVVASTWWLVTKLIDKAIDWH